MLFFSDTYRPGTFTGGDAFRGAETSKAFKDLPDITNYIETKIQ